MKKHLPALTGVRYLLAIHVVLFHFSPAYEGLPAAIANFLGSGYVAVPMFFVLSGFVLAYTYGAPAHPAEPPRASLDRRRFWVARFARIYPLYLMAFLLTSIYSLVPPPGETGPDIFDPVAGLGQVLAIHAWVPAWSLGWNLPSWSISIEFFFYLAFPFFALQTLRRRRTSSLVLLIAAMWLAGTAAPWLYTRWDPDHLGFMSSTGLEGAFVDAFWLKLVKFVPLLHLPEFVIGVATCGIFLADLRNGRERSPLLLTAVPVAVLVLVLSLSSRIPYPLIHNATLAPIFAALVLGLAHGKGAVARVLSLPGFIVLGNASYAVYILQFPLAIPIFGAGSEFLSFPVILGYVLILTLLAIASERWVERPMRRYLKRKLDAAGSASASPPEAPLSWNDSAPDHRAGSSPSSSGLRG